MVENGFITLFSFIMPLSAPAFLWTAESIPTFLPRRARPSMIWPLPISPATSLTTGALTRQPCGAHFSPFAELFVLAPRCSVLLHPPFALPGTLFPSTCPANSCSSFTSQVKCSLLQPTLRSRSHTCPRHPALSPLLTLCAHPASPQRPALCRPASRRAYCCTPRSWHS